jgi:hypothetical protein
MARAVSVACLKLCMSQPAVDQDRYAAVVQEFLEVVQGRQQFVDRRRHVGRVGERASGWADPILAATKLPWCPLSSPNAG